MKSFGVYEFFARKPAGERIVAPRSEQICSISCPSSVSRTTTALWWSIHMPALIVIIHLVLSLRFDAEAVPRGVHRNCELSRHRTNQAQKKRRGRVPVGLSHVGL